MPTIYDSDWNHHPGHAMKVLRRSLKLSQERFGVVVGIHRHSVSRYERGIRPLTPTHLNKIRKVFAQELRLLATVQAPAQHPAIKRRRDQYQWEKQQAKHPLSVQAKNDRERFLNAKSPKLRRLSNWSTAAFLSAVIYFALWQLIASGIAPGVPLTLLNSLIAVLCALSVAALAPLQIVDFWQFVRNQRRYYPPELTLPHATHPYAWSWRLVWQLKRLTRRLSGNEPAP